MMNNEQQTEREDTIHYIDEDIDGIAVPNVGFKAPVPWDGWTEEQRRAEFKGFLYPAWHPFAALEGNYEGSPHFDRTGMVAPKKSSESQDALEIRKKQFAVPMHNKAIYTKQPVPPMMKKAA